MSLRGRSGAALLFVALVALIFASFIFRSQFHGEDEVGVYITGNWLAEALTTGNWVSFFSVLVGSYHPPGRFLLAAASFLIAGPSVVALRFPAVLLWVITCVLAADVTRRQAGTVPAVVTGLLLGASGLFSLEALGFGHGVLTFWVMLFIWFKLRNPTWDLDSRRARRDYLIGGALLAAGFLWFTSLLPIVGMYHLYYLGRAARGGGVPKVRQWLTLTLPFMFFYVLYYLVFLGLPEYAVMHGLRDHAVGQLHQNIARSASARLNVVSLLDNLRGLNWYHLPFISWLLLVVGIVWQWRHQRVLFYILTPYALIFSFYIIDNTAQHFLSYYIWLLPFAIIGLWQWAAQRGRDWQGAVTCMLVALCVATASFGYITSVRQYTEASYPYSLADKVWGSGKWRTNLMRPLPAIAQDLAQRLGPEDHWTVTIDGSLPLYYFPDSRYIESAPCEELRAIVRSRGQSNICDVSIERIITYPDSFLELVILND